MGKTLVELAVRLRDAMTGALDRRLGFWAATAVIGLVLPVPIALVAVAARIRARRSALPTRGAAPSRTSSAEPAEPDRLRLAA